MKMDTTTDIDRLIYARAVVTFAFGMAAGIVLTALCMRWAVVV